MYVHYFLLLTLILFSIEENNNVECFTTANVKYSNQYCHLNARKVSDQLHNYSNNKKLKELFKKDKAWTNKEVLVNFANQYIPTFTVNNNNNSNTQKLFDQLEKLDEQDLLQSLDEYVTMLHDSIQDHPDDANDAVTISEKYIADAIMNIVTPMDKIIDTSRIVSHPKRLIRPVYGSKLFKVLAKDPNYFNH